MYCYGSKLRGGEMSLGEVCKTLEISQGEMAAALGMPKPTVRSYIEGISARRQTLDRIYRYCNRREFYRGYRFIPSAAFSELLDRISGALKSRLTDGEFAKKIGISGKKLSLIKSGWLTGSAVRLDVCEQYGILMTAYEQCADENGYVPPELESVYDELGDILAVHYPDEIKSGFARIIDDVLKARRLTDREIIETLYPENKRQDYLDYHSRRGDIDTKKVIFLARIKQAIGLCDGDDLEKLRTDDEFIMNLDLRWGIVERLAELFGGAALFSEKVMPYSLRRARSATLNSAEILKDADIQERGGISFLYRYPEQLQEIILDHGYAFVEEEKNYRFAEFLMKNYPEDSGLYLLEEFDDGGAAYSDMVVTGNDGREYYFIPYANAAWYKMNICERFLNRSDEDKKKACEEITRSIAKRIQGDPSLVTELCRLPEFSASGRLALCSETDIHFAEMSDVAQLVMITGQVGCLRDCFSKVSRSSSASGKAVKNREYVLELLKNSADPYCSRLQELVELKLAFSSLDWLLWKCLSQAVFLACTLSGKEFPFLWGKPF